MRILGIDPGYAIVGFGLISADKGEQKLLNCGAINTKAGDELALRLMQIQDDVTQLLDVFKPDAVAIEQLFFNTNITTGINVAQARGVIIVACKRAEVPIFEYTPLQVKQAVTGYGKAEKRQVMEMTKRLLGLDEQPKPDDAADAVAIALCHARSSTSMLARINLKG